MQLTEHFTLAELIASDTAMRMGIDNKPPEFIIDRLQRVAYMLEMIRSALNRPHHPIVYMHVNSGYRCEALEKIITRKDFLAWCDRHGRVRDEANWEEYLSHKAHPKGNAADFVAPNFGTPLEIVKFLSAQPQIMGRVDQIIQEGNWVHVGLSDQPRHQVLTATFDEHGVPHYTQGIG